MRELRQQHLFHSIVSGSMALHMETGHTSSTSSNPSIEPIRAAILQAQFRERRARINDALAEEQSPQNWSA